MEKPFFPYYIKNIPKHGPHQENPRNEAQRVNCFNQVVKFTPRGGT
jgi:hypothetical protein